jgi:hypothetical protein
MPADYFYFELHYFISIRVVKSFFRKARQKRKARLTFDGQAGFFFVPVATN